MIQAQWLDQARTGLTVHHFDFHLAGCRCKVLVSEYNAGFREGQ